MRLMMTEFLYISIQLILYGICKILRLNCHISLERAFQESSNNIFFWFYAWLF